MTHRQTLALAARDACTKLADSIYREIIHLRDANDVDIAHNHNIGLTNPQDEMRRLLAEDIAYRRALIDDLI